MAVMLDMIRSLHAHQAWADASIVAAIVKHEAAAQDETLRKTLHHMVLVQRAYLALFQKRPFDFVFEMRTPESLAEVERLFRDAHAEQIALVSQWQETDLVKPFDMPYIPGLALTNGEAHMQVVMHSQHHRGQCAARLRSLGGVPPTVDFVIWLKDRPAAWS
jgi:uncharacterized damage-inducible protein DinB